MIIGEPCDPCEILEEELLPSGGISSLEELPFYVAFNYFKITCIVQGVYARFQRGVRSTQGLDLDAFRKRIMGLARSAENLTQTPGAAGNHGHFSFQIKKR